LEIRRTAFPRKRPPSQALQAAARRPNLLQGNEGQGGGGQAARIKVMRSGELQQSPYIYDDRFFRTADQTAAAAADGLLPHVAAELPIRSVLDVGCGRGVWLACWLRHGANEVLGVDGSYVDPEQLAIPRSAFGALDVSAPFSLGRPFDLVQSLEVAEHLDQTWAEPCSATLVAP